MERDRQTLTASKAVREKSSITDNTDFGQIQRFDASPDWWDRHGAWRALHDINPARMTFIRTALARHAGISDLGGLRAVDLGCGAGILSAALARAGAKVTAVDAGKEAIKAGRLYAKDNNLDIDFHRQSAEQHQSAEPYDLAACCELLEHVPDYARLVSDCARLVRPGGLVVFSTLTRTPTSFIGAIAGAEYLFNIVPRGTHRYTDFIRPGELDQCARQCGLHPVSLSGLSYRPWQRQCSLSADISINYLMACVRSAD